MDTTKPSIKQNIKTDYQILKENFKFIWDSKNSKEDPKWEESFAKSYYDKLFKEFCIGDLSHYKDGKIGLRWCNEQDLLSGKGYKICGNTICQVDANLAPYEVNMKYREDNQSKNALVKINLCESCGKKLNKMYKYLHKKRKRSEKNIEK